MKYRDLRDFLRQLEAVGELTRVADAVSPRLEMTALADRVLRAGGPALLFTAPAGHGIPVLANLFGTPRRVAMGMGAESVDELREIGKLLAFLKEPEPPKGLGDDHPQIARSASSGLEDAGRSADADGEGDDGR